ncbi:MAG TPA: hypothetical protein VGA21_10565 [Cyclobacteriaceae bacterium]
MKIRNTLLYSASIGIFAIGIHQGLTVGWAYSYWIFMISVSFLLILKVLTNKEKER